MDLRVYQKKTDFRNKTTLFVVNLPFSNNNDETCGQ